MLHVAWRAAAAKARVCQLQRRPNHLLCLAPPSSAQPVVGVPFQFKQKANIEALRALGMAEVSPEAPHVRHEGQRFTREGLGGLMRKVSSSMGGWRSLSWERGP